MGYEVATQVRTDLASIKADALDMQRIAGAPAAISGGQGHHESFGFVHSMNEALRSVDDKDRLAADKMAEVDSGRSDDLVGAMLASQEASLSFSMLMQVRNKVMGAVEDLIKLPL